TVLRPCRAFYGCLRLRGRLGGRCGRGRCTDTLCRRRARLGGRRSSSRSGTVLVGAVVVAVLVGRAASLGGGHRQDRAEHGRVDRTQVADGPRELLAGGLAVTRDEQRT